MLMIKQFNWEEFKDMDNNIAVHCKTEEEAINLCNQMDKHGMKWIDGLSYLTSTQYARYKEQTCYTGYGAYASFDYYKGKNYTILEWSDYMQREFTKADLKNGMVIEYSNGKRRLVLNNYLIGKDGYYELSQYRENMKDKEDSDRDIMRVFTISIVTTLDRIFHIENLNLIWERKETKKMTVEEMKNKLEELTGEKIEVELSNEEKYGKILQHCKSTSCSKCCLSDFGYCTWEYDSTNTKNVEDCYTKMMEQKNRDKIVMNDK